MKKIYIPLAISAFFFTGTALAGYTGPNAMANTTTVKTVKQVQALPDDTKVTIEGYITKRIKKKHYTFTDSSGSMTVEIDNDVWQGQDIGPKDKVSIYGKVDKDWNATEVEAKMLSTIK